MTAAPIAAALGDAPNGATTLLSVHRNGPVICAVCGKRTERKMRGQRYCSARCRDRSRSRSRKAFLGRNTGAPTTPRKSSNQINPLPRRKTGSSLYANAPLNILGGGSWRRPDTPKLDAETLARIVSSEIGARGSNDF
jgi:hypothetical protein